MREVGCGSRENCEAATEDNTWHLHATAGHTTAKAVVYHAAATSQAREPLRPFEII